MTDTNHLTVGRLRALLADRPDDEKVVVHAGWDFPIMDDEYDFPRPWDDDGFVMFLDYEDSATMVNKDWAEKHHNCSGWEKVTDGGDQATSDPNGADDPPLAPPSPQPI